VVTAAESNLFIYGLSIYTRYDDACGTSRCETELCCKSVHYYPLTGLTISGETFQFYDSETTITTINALNTLLVKPYNVFITQSHSSSWWLLNLRWTGSSVFST